MQNDLDKMHETAEFLMGLIAAGKKSPGNEDNHYFGQIEPIDFIEDQQLGYHEGSIIKYVSRWRYKGGIQDLFKAGWFLVRLIQFEQRRIKAAKQEEKPNERKPRRKQKA